MQLSIVTTDDLKAKEIDLTNVVHLVIRIGNVNYTLSEREGALRVSVDGQLVAMPCASNMVLLSSVR